MLKKFLKSLKISIVIIGVLYITSYFFTINLTESMPKGIYIMYPAINLKKGDIVLIPIVPEAKKYVPNKTKYMIKILAGTSEDKILIKNDELFINNQSWGKIYEIDGDGEKLPKANLKIKKDEVLLLVKTDRSFDGRYFGAIKKKNIKRKARLIYQF